VRLFLDFREKQIPRCARDDSKRAFPAARQALAANRDWAIEKKREQAPALQIELSTTVSIAVGLEESRKSLRFDATGMAEATQERRGPISIYERAFRR
jgi:hypothetical protein